MTIKRLRRQFKARNDPKRIDARYEWVMKYDNSDMDFLQNCIFIDESGFDINMRPSYGRSVSGTSAIASTPSTKAESHSILGVIATVGVVNIDVRVPQMNKRIKVAGGPKRKTATTKKSRKKGTTTGHYLNFLSGTLDHLDKYPELKGFYLVMDNAPIHNHEEIETLVTNRGYRCVCIPPYSPELNSIEQFWSLVKNRVNKRSKFKDKEDLFTRIRDACNEVPRGIITKSVEHSVEALEKCRNKQPLQLGLIECSMYALKVSHILLFDFLQYAAWKFYTEF